MSYKYKIDIDEKQTKLYSLLDTVMVTAKLLDAEAVYMCKSPHYYKIYSLLQNIKRRKFEEILNQDTK
jgi:hypothetical protein